MIALIWTLFFSIATHGHGDHGKDVIEKIEKTQKAMQNMGGPLLPTTGYCPDCATQGHPADNRAACARAICEGKETQPINNIENDAIRKAPQVDARAEAAKLEAIFKRWWDSKAKENKIYQDALRGFDGKPNADQLRFMAYAKLIDKIDEFETDAKAVGRVSIAMTVNLDKTAARNGDLRMQELATLKEMADDFYARPYQESLQASSYPMDVFLREKYPNMNREQAFRREIEITEKSLREVEAHPQFATYAKPLGAHTIRQDLDLTGWAKESNPSDQQFRTLINSRSSLALLKEVIDKDSDMSKIAAKYDWSQNFDPRMRERKLDQLVESASQLADSRQRERYQNRFMARCLARVTYAAQVLPNEKQIQQASQNAQAAIGTIENKILPKFSKPTRDAATPKLRATRFVFPPTAGEFRRGFNDFLDQQNRVISNDSEATGDFALVQAINSDPQIDAKLNTLAAQCDRPQFQQRMVSDASYGANGSIQVGWGSTRDPQFGRFVLGHELGHRLADIFSQIQMSAHSATRHKEIRQCLTVKQMNGGKVTEHYLSEDWADWIGAEVIGNIGPNPWCWRIDFGGLKDGSTTLSLRENSGDEHSSPFFRLVQIHRQSGRTLPAGCKQALLEENPMIAEHYDCGQPPPALPAGTGGLLPGYGMPLPNPAK